jgi:hypothetical protein
MTIAYPSRHTDNEPRKTHERSWLMSLDNLLRPRSLALNVYLTVMTCGVWLFVWAAARRRATAA